MIIVYMGCYYFRIIIGNITEYEYKQVEVS
jgi:hypothetical protein